MIRQIFWNPCWRGGLISIGLLIGAFASAAATDADSYAIQNALSGNVPEVVTTFRDFSLLNDVVTAFYQERDYLPAWLSADGLSPAAHAAIEALGNASEHGLRPGDYVIGPLTNLQFYESPVGVSREQRARLELGITLGIMRYMKDLHEGRYAPKDLGLGLELQHETIDYIGEVTALLDAENIQASLDSVAPRWPIYQELKTALTTYRALAERGEPKPLVGQVIHPGEPYAEAAALRQRLQLTGDLDAADAAGADIYDPALAAAVERFQQRHGLGTDGVLGPKTFAALNRTWTDRADQIAMGMERARWIPDDPGTHSIIVNVPEFDLFAAHVPPKGDPVIEFRSRVIVGKAYGRYKTPIFSDEVQYLIFRPYWNIPRSIIRNEMASRLRTEPDYVSSKNMEIVPQFGPDVPVLEDTPENREKVVQGTYQLRQGPGPDNSLGLVKFIFPNEYNVYLHSTPAQQLFDHTRRDFSHGCIRVGDPEGLANWILADQPEWTPETIHSAMNEGSREQVNVNRPTSVYILYSTALVNPLDGLLYFYEDIYGLDAALKEKLGSTLAERLDRSG